MDTSTQTYQAGGQRTLKELLSTYWVFVVGVVLVFWLMSAAAAFLMTPVYQSTIVVLPTTGMGEFGGGGGVLGSIGNLGAVLGLGSSQGQVATEAEALLNSQGFTEQFIREHGLLQKLFASRWDAVHSRWRNAQWPNSAPPTLHDGYRLFAEQIRRVLEDKKGSITVEVNWTNPVDAAQWANEMIQEVNQAMRQRAIGRAEATIDALNDELKTARAIEERDAIAQSLETYVKARALAQARPDYAFTVVDPAVPSDLKDYIRPQRVLYLIGGPVLGFLIALFALVSWDYYTRQSVRDRRGVYRQ